MRVINKTKSVGMKMMNRLLRLFECRPLRHAPPDPKIIFIIGPPRSGTTLFYQLLVKHFEVGYVYNRIAPFYGGYSIVSRFWKKGINDSTGEFKSNHGRTAGYWGPHEAGEYWYQFFPRDPHYTSVEDLSHKKLTRLRVSMARICASFGKPVVFKNVVNSARLRVLEAVFPSAVFIEIKRDFVENARSILVAKRKSQQDPGLWWSVMPQGYEAVQGEAPLNQAVHQVFLTKKMIHSDRPKRYVSVQYESLCENPVGELKRVSQELGELGISIQRREGESVPKSFPVSQNININKSEYKALQDQIRKVCGDE